MARRVRNEPYPFGICTIYPPTENKKVWRVRWFQEGERFERTSQSREGAEELAQRASAQAERGATLADVEKKVAFLAKRYLATLGEGRYEERQEGLLRLWILPEIGKLDIDQWTPARSLEVLRKMRDARISQARVQNAGQCMRALITFAQQQRWMSRSDDPMFKVRYTAKADIQGEKSIFIAREGLPTEERIQDFLTAAEKYPHWSTWRTAWELTARSGLRWSELIGLRPVDIDFNLRSIAVTRAIEETGPGKMRVKSTKSGLKRSTIFPESIAGRLEELVTIVRRERGPLEPLFPGDRGQWAKRTAHRRRWIRVAQVAGWPKDPDSRSKQWPAPLWSIHDFRHFAACWMLYDLKADISLVAQWLGHASPSFTLDCYVGHRGNPEKQGHILTEGW